ncbi:MAG TPA: hypothetical protein DCZ92_09600 [Elusimicrobia bacterium]|nr:MAG: hypothetical protein A2016_11555 [Elusimicrobia bacterium GWF2_62_30]HBA61055.1 hypothetical protein [Elusimicrobiota bacterium]
MAAAAFCALPAGAQDLAGPATAYSEVPQEVLVKSEAEEIRTKKPPLKVKTDNFESIKNSFESDKNLFLFESGNFISFFRNYPEKLSNGRVIKPWRTSFNDRTVIAFYPLKKFEEVFGRNYAEKVTKDFQWTLSITDEEGRNFHRYSGAGLPPETINWSGENDQHEWVHAGHSYAPLYVFTEAQGVRKTVIGELVRFTAIVYQKGNSLVISMDSALLFGSNKSAKTVEKPGGEALLAAAADLIKRRYYNIPLKVNVYAQTKDLSDQQASQVRDSLKASLMCGENLLSYEGFDDTFAQQRTDIVLLNK